MTPATTAQFESFSHLADVGVVAQPCQGLACFVARRLNPDRWEEARTADPRVYCLGKCHAGPASAAESVRTHAQSALSRPVVLERVGTGAATTIETYRRHGGFAGLERALAMPRDAVVATIEGSALRGRGGAGFPAGRKWRSAFAQSSGPKFVVCNADEGDPGAYVDRVLLEDDPYCVLEAMTIAAYADRRGAGYTSTSGASIPTRPPSLDRAAATRAFERVARTGRIGSGRWFDVRIVRGKGSYVCGEETALLNAIEGRRPEVRARPPFPTVRACSGNPTLVHNVETLANVPWILREGADSYRARSVVARAEAPRFCR